MEHWELPSGSEHLITSADSFHISVIFVKSLVEDVIDALYEM